MPIFPFGKQNKGRTEDSSDNYSLGSTEHFQWIAESGVDSVTGADWITKNAVPYLEEAYKLYRDEILQVGDLLRLPVTVIVRASSNCSGGIAGATGDGNLNYCAGEWNSNQHCYGIITHELCNLFTGECVSRGWPTAWWANHRSPFPTMIANEVMSVLVPKYYRMWGDHSDPLVQMFERLYKTYPGMFSRMFQKMRELSVTLSEFEDPSQVVYYFMFHGAQRALGRSFVCPPMPQIDFRAFQTLESRFHLGVLTLPTE
ncbi:MAG: hypothetical protein ACYCPW_05385 [Nitrososphaerales archaeon]